MLQYPTPYPLDSTPLPRERYYGGDAAVKNIEATRKKSGGDKDGKVVLPEIKLKDLRGN